MTPQELEQLQALLGIGSTAMSHDTAAPRALPPPDPAEPYNKQAGVYRTQADDLERQAATPYPQPQGVGQRVVSALRAGMENFGRLGAPGGYYGQEQIRQKQFTDENKQRIERAKELRGQSQQQQELGQTVVQRGVQNKLQTGQLDETRRLREIQEKDSASRTEQANRPIVTTTSPGSTTTARDPKTGLPIAGSETSVAARPPAEKNQGFRDKVNGKGETVREYFEQSDPSQVTFSENLGVKRTPENDYSGKVQAQATINGVPVVGVLDKATGVFTPATTSGGAPVQNATEGNANSKAGSNATVDLIGAKRLYKTMQDTLGRIESGKSTAPGADDMVLLSNHIAMTFGTVKGARTGKDLIEAHLRARSLPDNLSVIATRVFNGEQLTPGQRREFVELAARRVNELEQSRQDLEEYFGGSQTPTPGPKAPTAGGPKRIRIN